MKKKIKKIPKYKWGAQNTAAMITTVGNAAAGAAGVSQDSTAGNLMKGAGAGLSMIPTPYTQIAGAVLSTVGSLWGNTGSVNEHTGEINKASGFSKWLGLGPSSSELEAKSNRVKNSIVDKDITEHLRAEYYMDPNNGANNNIFYAAEGGIAPNLTPAYLDSREVVVSPDRGSAVRLPYAEGTDTIPAMVMPYSGVLSEDIEYKKGISFADLGDKIDKSFPDNTRAKQLLMQKALNVQEMKKVSKKTKNGVPAYVGGDSSIKPYKYGVDTGQGTFEEFSEYNPLLKDYGPNYLKFIKNLDQSQFDKWVKPKWDEWFKNYGKTNKTIPSLDEFKRLAVDKKIGDLHRIAANAFDAYMRGPLAAPNSRTALNNNIQLLPGMNSYQNKYSVGPLDITSKYTAPSITRASMNPELKRHDELMAKANDVIAKGAPKTQGGLDFDMLDYLNLAGPLANMFAPDAEAVRDHTISPVYGPTNHDATPEMRQIASNRATANYDANQVNPNTGANMAFTAMTQLNSDKAAAAALSNKANIQNQLAFQNANIANSAMQFNANASHTAEVESAQNRVAARKIRRKGFGDFFTNIGKIRQDKRLSARDEGLYQAMLPYLEYGMTSDQLKKLTKLYA